MAKAATPSTAPAPPPATSTNPAPGAPASDGAGLGAASVSGGAAHQLHDASGERTAEARSPEAQAVTDALVREQADEVALRRLSVPAAGPVPRPLPPVQPWGTKSNATRAPEHVASAFNRAYTIETLLDHPSAEVRQRAEEAQVSLHHNAADAGMKVRAAIDTAKALEPTR